MTKGNTRLHRGKRALWISYLQIALLYVFALPLVKLLDLFGQWPGVLSRGVNRGMRKFSSYQPTAHDVLVCSYFKSGTNWTLHMAVQVAHRGRASFDHIHDLVPWLELTPELRFAADIHDDSIWQQAPTGLRVIKTHLAFDRVPYTPAARYICVVRDPKDVFVSSYHFVRDAMLGPMMPCADKWLETFLSKDTMFGSWAAHVHSCWQVRHRSNVLFLTYEEMKADLPGTIRKIAQVMNVELSAEEFAAVVRQSSFQHMKSIGYKFDPVGLSPAWVKGKQTMIRRGERSSASELLCAEDQQRIDNYWRAELQRLQCDFPYDQAFCAQRTIATGANA